VSPKDQGGDNALDSDGEPALASPAYGQTAVFTLGQIQVDRTWDLGVTAAKPAIDVEKYVTGGAATRDDADTPKGPFVPTGATVTWTYVVKNTGNTTLVGIQVTDDDPAVTVSCPQDTTLAPGESLECTATGVAISGQYVNVGTATGTPADDAETPLPGVGPVTDTDPAHYYGASPAIKIVKYTNDQDANEAPGPYVLKDGEVTWKYVVTNTGNTDLNNIKITDDKEGDISCPNAPQTLAPGASFECLKTGKAVEGQYANDGKVTGTPIDGSGSTIPGSGPVEAHDPSHYFGAHPTIKIVKKVNGDDADTAPGPYVPEKSEVTWTYEVTNTGNTKLVDVTVVDTPEGAVTCPAATLAPGESMTCTLTGVAKAGQYENVGKVTGKPVDNGDQPIPGAPEVTADNPAHYFGTAPGIKIVKKTNGDDANAAPGPQVTQGSKVTWTYEVTNTGNTRLTSVAVTDSIEGAISCPKNDLQPGESMTCTKNGTAVLGQYENKGTVEGAPSKADGTPIDGAKKVTADDLSHYLGQAPPLPFTPNGTAKPGQLALTGPPLPLPGIALAGVLLALLGAAGLVLSAARRRRRE
ncbi:hypothetical protein UK23_31150, partial [Lentzea aerocolonigenes]